MSYPLDTKYKDESKEILVEIDADILSSSDEEMKNVMMNIIMTKRKFSVKRGQDLE